ncbi:DNA-binding transcriptional regulator, MarR family [Lentzea fradiae]|uniref:DNA-binding transcriptional regulator, MarR family n=1 Tax=Lentzea fradiae TaxID=200378 RepID=A0A1G8A0D6_9PSEU|nr:MarR family transcriptional regulator [Lentzea fradiae]SDH14392.1 DNA-binding transcriptional regulator, MarR family [Lentzea fradiae]
MENTPERLTGKPSWLLTQLSVHAHRLATEAFTGAGARGYHYRVLAALDEFGTASQADLGRRCNMDRSDVVATVTALQERGFVDRAQDPKDRRRNTVTLTEPGKAQLDRLDEALDQAQDDLLAPLPEPDRRTLTRLLGTLLAHHQR